MEGARERLRALRRSGERRSAEVLSLVRRWRARITGLGDEKWLVYEQAYVAALDCLRLLDPFHVRPPPPRDTSAPAHPLMADATRRTVSPSSSSASLRLSASRGSMGWHTRPEGT